MTTLTYLAYADAVLLLLTYIMARPALAKVGHAKIKLGFWRSAATIVMVQSVAPLLAIGMLNRWIVTNVLGFILRSKATAVLVVDTMEDEIMLKRQPKEVQLHLFTDKQLECQKKKRRVFHPG